MSNDFMNKEQREEHFASLTKELNTLLTAGYTLQFPTATYAPTGVDNGKTYYVGCAGDF